MEHFSVMIRCVTLVTNAKVKTRGVGEPDGQYAQLFGHGTQKTVEELDTLLFEYIVK